MVKIYIFLIFTKVSIRLFINFIIICIFYNVCISEFHISYIFINLCICIFIVSRCTTAHHEMKGDGMIMCCLGEQCPILS